MATLAEGAEAPKAHAEAVQVMSASYRVSIAKQGRVFWSSQWVSKDRAEDIRRKNQRLVDRHGWNHVVGIETAAGKGE